MTRVLVVGGGVAGLLTTQLLLDRADDLSRSARGVWDETGPSTPDEPGQVPQPAGALDVTLLVHRPGDLTASRSGGLALRYASTDARGDRWTARSGELAVALGARHPHLRGSVGSTSALLVSRLGPVVGYPGTAVDPSRHGMPHAWGVEHQPGPQWDPCGLLPRWPATLAADPRVRLADLPERVGSVHDLAVLHDRHQADVTVACLGLGAHALGDRRLTGRLGVLLRGPLPVGSVHAERAVIDDDDALRPRYTVPHPSSGADGRGRGGHLHVGGTYLPVDDPADWDDPERLRARAEAEVPALLADAVERFPDLAGWRPDGGPWWGIRPVRDEVALARVDPTLVDGRDVVVSHGWGGSGWTIGPAVAEETARAVLPGDGEDPLAAYGWWRP